MGAIDRDDLAELRATLRAELLAELRTIAAAPLMLNKEELAVVLGVGVSWVRDAITARSIPITWIGGKARFGPQDIADIIAARREVPVAARSPLDFHPTRRASRRRHTRGAA